MSIIYDVDGAPLVDPSGRWWVTADGSSVSQGVEVRAADVQVPGMSGIAASLVREPWEAVELNLRVMVRSRDPEVREMFFDAVKAAFTRSALFTLGRKVGGGERRTATVKLRSISEPELYAAQGAQVCVITVVILDGRFHSPAQDSSHPLATATAVALPRLGGSAPVENWILRVKGSFTAVTVTDNRSQTSVTYTGAVGASDYLYLSGVSARRSTSATAWTSGGTDVSGGVSVGPRGLLAMTPSWAGTILDRAVNLTVATTAPSGAELTIRAGAAWI